MNSDWKNSFRQQVLKVSLFVLLISPLILQAQKPGEYRIEPPEWWIGMKDPEVQILLNYAEAGSYVASIANPGVQILRQEKTESPNYLLITLKINPDAQAGKMPIQLSRDKKKKLSFPFTLHKRNPEIFGKRPYQSSDIIYLLMPDRFANGNPGNDNLSQMREKADRLNPDGRHGGDIQGIIKNLDYLKDFGISALWLNPVYENNQERLSYHGYSITNHYQTDARFGGNESYAQFVQACHDRDIVVIKDMIFNHIGSFHPWMSDLPYKNWIHQWDQFTRTNYRASVLADPYVSEFDKKLFFEGWFDTTMPDLNQKDPVLMRYLTQQSIWWIEKFGLNGIRMDTQAYNDPQAMSQWARKVKQEYPDLFLLGEIWDGNVGLMSHWNQDQIRTNYQSNLDAITDFPIHDAVKMGLNESEGWQEGFGRMYKILGEDHLYRDPFTNVIFPDNHDVERIFEVLGKDPQKMKMALVYYYTMRGNLQLYYGTEILMTGNKSKGDGAIRADMPGGWTADEKSGFALEGLSKAERENYELMRFLNYWRRGNSAIYGGKLVQYIPFSGVYTYLRYNDQKTYLIVLNKNDNEIVLDPARFSDHFKRFNMARDILSGVEMKKLTEIKVPAKDGMILELGKFGQ
jgi:neopullulanase